MATFSKPFITKNGVEPGSNNSVDIGSSTNQFKNVYSNSVIVTGGISNTTGVILHSNGTIDLSSISTSGNIVAGESFIGDSIFVDRVDTNTQIIQSHLDFNPIPETQTYQEGRLFYDSVHKTFNYNTDVDNVHLELGENVYIRVYNDTSNTLPNGSALYLEGYTSTDPVVPKAQLADASDSVKYNTSGLAAHSIEAGTYGYCAVVGVVRGSDQDPFDTSYLTAGERAFVSFETPGLLVQPAPSYPNFPMCMGLVVISDANNGVFVVEQQMHAVPNFRVAGDVYVGNDLTVAGNFSVLGTETTTSVTNLNVANTYMYLGTGDSVANTEFSGTGLNDAEYRDYYDGTATKTYSVRIDSVGATDTFEWSDDNFVTTEATGVAITGGDQLLNNHIKIHFEAITGHTLGDRWDGDVAPSNLDHGVVANYSNSTLYTHTGYFRDSSDDQFKFFKRYDPEAEGSINVGHASFQYADIRANSFFGHTITANVTGDVSGTVSDISNHSTSDLSEGTNLYYTTARVNTAIDNRVTRSFVDNLGVNAQLLDSEEGGFYRIESAAYTVANNTLTFTRGDANTFDLVLTGVANTSATVNTSTSSASFAVANNTITFTRQDSSTYDVSIHDNTSVSSASFAAANNTITFTRDDSSTFDVQIHDNTSVSSASFESTNNTITFTRDDSSNFDVTIGGGVTSGALVGNNIVLTKSDSSTIDIDVNSLVNDVIQSGSYSVANNTLSLIDDQNDAIDITLTGVANTSSPSFSGSVDIGGSLDVEDNIRADTLDVIETVTANTVSATRFVGDGSQLTGIEATDLDGENGGFYRVESAAWEDSNNTLTFTRGDANTFDVGISFSEYVNPANTSLSSAAWADANNTLTFTRADSSTTDVQISFSEYVNPANTSTSSGAYTVANNTLTLTRADSSTFDLALTGLANTSSPNFTGSVDIAGSLDVEDNLRVDTIDALGTVTANTFIGDGSALTGIQGLPVTIDVENTSVNAFADGANSIAIGAGAATGLAADSETNMIAIGTDAIATHQYGLAIGYQTKATDDYSVAIGWTAQAVSGRGTAVGMEAKAGNRSVAIGEDAAANFASESGSGSDGVAIGNGARAQSSQAISILFGQASGEKAVSIGYAANATGVSTFATGWLANASANHAIAIGRLANSQSNNTITIGYQATAVGNDAIAIGSNSVISGGHHNAISIGKDARALENDVVVIGREAGSTSSSDFLGGESINIGYSSFGKGVSIGDRAASNTRAVAVGAEAKANGSYSLALGHRTRATGLRSIAIGPGDTSLDAGANVSGDYAIGIGYKTVVSGENSVAIGYEVGVTDANTIALGTSSFKVQVDGDLILGTGINANGSYGTASQVLKTDGDKVYWDSVNVNGAFTQNGDDIFYDAGNVAIGSANTSDFKLHVTGDVFATENFISASDEFIKKDVETLSDVLDNIDSIRGVSYRFVDNDRPSIGVIAQEVETVYPQLVRESDSILGVDYNGLVGVLVQAVKELKTELADVKQRVKELEDERI